MIKFNANKAYGFVSEEAVKGYKQYETYEFYHERNEIVLFSADAKIKIKVYFRIPGERRVEI